MRKTTAVLIGILFAILAACCSQAAHGQGILPDYLRAISAPPESRNAVTLYGDITNDSAAEVIEQIHAANKLPTDAPLPMYIDSPGGSVVAGGKIIDAMLVSRRPIVTVDVSIAASMAAIVHSYGVKRYMFPHATIMLHWAHAEMDGDLPRLRSRLDWMQLMVEQHDRHTCKVSKITRAELRAHEAIEWYLMADEAKTRGLVDAVIDVRDYPAR